MDFYRIKERALKGGVVELYPDWVVSRSRDLMVRGRAFYAIWDEKKQVWSKDEYDVQRLVDTELMEARDKLAAKNDGVIHAKLMSDFSTSSWVQFRNWLGHISDNSKDLDVKLTFANTEVKKKDYVSKKLPYPLEAGSIDAYEELIGTLYDPEERKKLEWAIGAVVAGDAKDIQKFVVLYGEAGAGKSTLLSIVQRLFVGYYTTFDAKALTTAGNSFSTEVFKGNPLVAIQHDGDLSRIDDNSKLNSIVSHEDMTMNEKYRPSYTARVNCFLFMATNKPVKITDAKSGLIRRLIDVRTSGNKVTVKRYQTLMAQIDFELGAIAHHCLEVYREMGKNYYSGYRPVDMMLQTDVFYNFIEDNYYLFREQDGITLSQAYDMYKAYCEESLIEFKLPKHKFRDELKNYFANFSEVKRVDNKQVRSYYSGFLTYKFASVNSPVEPEAPYSLVLDSEISILDEALGTCPAQYADNDVPAHKWVNVTTTLSALDTTLLHYVKPPNNHIVIDFDIKDENGEKSPQRNLEAASSWPATYAEFSKSGGGLHLHYIYDGRIETVSRNYDDGIEIKIFNGDAALRRKLSKCNNIPIAHINSGLPEKGVKMINATAVKSERGLRDLIERNLNKEIHPSTKPSIDFILKILDDAFESGLRYDLTDMRPRVLNFALRSSNQSDICVKAVGKMQFQSADSPDIPNDSTYDTDGLVFYDVEVFPNLFLINWKFAGADQQMVRMINPTAQEVESLFKFKLVGFNCRRYDNHILYGRYIGHDLEQLYNLSQRIIGGSRNAFFGEAYNISYTDVLDFSSKKQSLKLFMIEQGMHHKELGLPWDQPVPEEKWIDVARYCDNDVFGTEATFYARKEDFAARQILAELSGLTVNDTTQMHAAKILFGNDKEPQKKFVYTDLKEEFIGYEFERGVSTYRGFEIGEGGFVYSEPGMYEDVALIDVASMHPTSIENLKFFGPYTARFSELKAARLAIKHKEFDRAKDMLGGILTKHLSTDESAMSLAAALKVILVSVYGYTAAKYESKFTHPSNIDNIVAKRGALFMVDLMFAIKEKGFTVAHVKTDSVKIPNATPEIIQFVFEFGKRYGYEFEHEATYSKMCLVNDAVYIARYKYGKKIDQWVAVGAEFQHPYVFKKIFTHEDILFDDLCEIKSVTTALYLDMNETLPEGEHDYHFIGRVGSFVPMKPGCGGGLLTRIKEGEHHAATGSKGYRWLEAEMVKALGKENDVDTEYHNTLVGKAMTHISTFGNLEWFVK